MKLTKKHQDFADYYIELGNAEEAAIKAGYSKNYARASAYKLLANIDMGNGTEAINTNFNTLPENSKQSSDAAFKLTADQVLLGREYSPMKQALKAFRFQGISINAIYNFISDWIWFVSDC